MSLVSGIYKDIIKEYQTKQDNAKKLLQVKKERIYTALPRIKEIDEELSKTGIKVTRAVLASPEETEKLVMELENQTKGLISERKSILESNGYPDNHLELEYECEECKDTGYIDNKKCKCFKQKFIDRAYSQSNLAKVLDKQNFKHFDIRYYSEDISNEEGISPRENMKKIFITCVDFAEKFGSEFQNLFFYGQAGLGKSFLCSCIAKEVLDKGYTVLYVTASQLFNMVEEERFNKNKEEAEELHEYLNTVLSVDLLIIDDLGTEIDTVVTSSELYNFINIRLLDERPTVISTNLSLRDCYNMYSDRVVSRIQGNYIIMKLFGEDIRVKKKFENI